MLMMSRDARSKTAAVQSQGRCLSVLEERAFVIGSVEVGVAFEIVLEPRAGTMDFCYRV